MSMNLKKEPILQPEKQGEASPGASRNRSEALASVMPQFQNEVNCQPLSKNKLQSCSEVDENNLKQQSNSSSEEIEKQSVKASSIAASDPGNVLNEINSSL